jgi:hypothetical protein
LVLVFSCLGYESGVYTGTCGTTIDRAVVLVASSAMAPSRPTTTTSSATPGARAGWGDEGHIKLVRHSDDDTAHCGVDTDPSSGTECKPYPKTQKACALCGMLCALR